MDIFYTNETLYVNINTKVTTSSILKLKRRIFRIIEEYEIDNVVLNVFGNQSYDNHLFDFFINEYNKSYNGNLKIRNTL